MDYNMFDEPVKNERIALRLTAGQKDLAKQMAASENRSLSEYLVSLILRDAMHDGHQVGSLIAPGSRLR